MRYPGHDEIGDPSSKLPTELADRIAPIIPRAVVRLRRGDVVGSTVLTEVAMEIFALLLASRSWESHTDIESVRRAVNGDAETALAYAHHIHQMAGYGRMSFICHKAIWDSLSLSEQAARIETEWWEHEARIQVPVEPIPAPSATDVGPEYGKRPRHPAAPDTPTARRIETFRRRIEAGGRPVKVRDMLAFCNYSDATMFQRVQREAPDASAAARETIERMLRCPSPEEFWRTVDRNRKGIEARLEKKIPPA